MKKKVYAYLHTHWDLEWYRDKEDFNLRLLEVFDIILDELKQKDYENVLIIAHSGVSKAFSGYFDGIQDGKFLKRGLKNCEIKEYELD